MSARLPHLVYAGPTESKKMDPPARHYEFVVDIGEAMGIASAIHHGRLADVIEHLCLDHVVDRLTRSRSLRLAAMIAVERCRRPCHRCEQAAVEQAAAEQAAAEQAAAEQAAAQKATRVVAL